MNTAPTTVVQPAFKKRFGLIAAKIGASFAHVLGVAMPLMPPEYSTATKQIGSRARTSVQKHTRHYRIGEPGVPGEKFPIEALPGATVVLAVQDINALEEELLEQVKWRCMHRDCKGKEWDSKRDLFEAHGENRKLVEEAQKDPSGAPHLYMGVLEIAGTKGEDARPEKRNDKGEVVAKAVPAREGSVPTVMLLSDEE